MARREFLSAAIVLLIVAHAPPRAQALDVRRPAQIILIRHTEKPADIANPHLDAGNRAAGGGCAQSRRADSLSREGLRRSRHADLVDTYVGKTVVICWNLEEIPQLAAALGVAPEPPKWKSSVFDVV
jgi:hypothetical protein